MNERIQRPRSGDFLLSKATGNYSIENRSPDTGDLLAGTVLGQVSASGNFTSLAPGADDGSEYAAGILLANSGAEALIAVITRNAEVKADALIWPASITAQKRADAIHQLTRLNIIVRGVEGT